MYLNTTFSKNIPSFGTFVSRHRTVWLEGTYTAHLVQLQTSLLKLLQRTLRFCNILYRIQNCRDDNRKSPFINVLAGTRFSVNFSLNAIPVVGQRAAGVRPGFLRRCVSAPFHTRIPPQKTQSVFSPLSPSRNNTMLQVIHSKLKTFSFL